MYKKSESLVMIFFSGATLDFRKGFVMYTFCILEVPRVSLGIWCAKSLKTSRRVQMTWLKNASTTHKLFSATWKSALAKLRRLTSAPL